jgi:hypothetical protein
MVTARARIKYMPHFYQKTFTIVNLCDYFTQINYTTAVTPEILNKTLQRLIHPVSLGFMKYCLIKKLT